MRALALIALLPLSALAQTALPEQPSPPLDPRKNQKIERLRVEDAANRVDELRVGGESQNVTVQPKGDMPAYELLPNDLARSRPADRREGFSGGSQRVWNVFSF